jgi:hypothetical protein
VFPTSQIDETNLASRGSVIAKSLESPIVAPIPAEPMIWVSLKNSVAELTGKEYVQGGVIVAL